MKRQFQNAMNVRELSHKLSYCEKSRTSWSHRDQNGVSRGTGLNCEVPQREDGAQLRREIESKLRLRGCKILYQSPKGIQDVSCISCNGTMQSFNLNSCSEIRQHEVKFRALEETGKGKMEASI